MKRGQVWIRGTDARGENWGAIDVLDLDDESFRAWVVSMLLRLGVVVSLKTEGEDIHYRAKFGAHVE